MAITRVITTLSDSRIGVATPNDGICMLFSIAVAQTGTGGLSFALNTPYLFTSLQQAEAHGLTADGNPILYPNVVEFYEKTGSGARLWVYGYATGDNATLNFIQSAAFEQAIRDTTITLRENRPRLIGFVGDDGTTTAPAPGLMIPAYAISVNEALTTALTNLFDKGFRMGAIQDVVAIYASTSGGISTETTATTLQDAAGFNSPKVSILLTTSTPGRTASIGEALGVYARLTPISISPGAVSTVGAIRQTAYFLDRYQTNYINTPVSAVPAETIDDIGSKQYFFARRRMRPGVFYNDGATCNSSINALSSMPFVRVGNAICDDAEWYIEGLIQENIPYDINTGKIDASFKGSTIATFYDEYLQPRINRGEAQEVEFTFEAHEGNYPRTKAIDVYVRIWGTPALEQAWIDVSFTVTASN